MKKEGKLASLSGSELIGWDVWIVTGVSESGDCYGPWVFFKEPNEDKLREICKERCDWTEDDGPGDFGSHTHLTVTKCTIE